MLRKCASNSDLRKLTSLRNPEWDYVLYENLNKVRKLSVLTRLIKYWLYSEQS